MAFTWTGNPAASLLEKIRFEFGDTDSTNPKFTDAEIDYVISVEHNVLNSVARLCEIYGTRCSDASSRSMGPLRVELSSRSKAYLERAKDIRKGITKSAKPYFGGIDQSKSDLFDADTTLKQPIFCNGLMDNE